MSLAHANQENNPPDAIPSGTPAPAWITEELVALTIRVWQPYYESPLSADDALDILLATGCLIAALSHRDQKESVGVANLRGDRESREPT